MVIVLAGCALAGGFFYEKLNSNITSISLNKYSRPQMTREDTRGNRPLNILFMGSDTRAGKNGTYGSNDHAPLSDSTMLLHVNAERTHAYVISIPRDTMVNRPSCQAYDGIGTVAGVNPVMFNTALAVGGPACTVHTVENMTGLFIDHFTEVDFDGFKRLVDAVGGVDVCLPNNVADYHAKLYLKKGRHHIYGATALAFARERYQIGNGGDLGRIKLQQQLLGSLLTQLHSEQVLFNPARLYKLGDIATKSITTDTGLSTVKDLISLGSDLRSIPPKDITFATMPTEPYTLDPNRLQPKQPQARTLWSALRYDALGGPSPSPSPSASPSAAAGPSESPAPHVTPGSVSLVVLNGTGTNARAANAATALRRLGYSTGYVGNAAANNHTTTIIEYPAGSGAQADVLKRSLPGSQLMRAVDLTSITVVVGSTFRLAGTSSNVSATPSASPGPSKIPTGIQTRVASTDICKAS